MLFNSVRTFGRRLKRVLNPADSITSDKQQDRLSERGIFVSKHELVPSVLEHEHTVTSIFISIGETSRFMGYKLRWSFSEMSKNIGCSKRDEGPSKLSNYNSSSVWCITMLNKL